MLPYDVTSLPMVFSAEVAAARAERRAVVALETTIITHGMPFPQNLQTAQEVEAIVRKCGAVPATIAVQDGAIHVGLEGPVLQSFARSDSPMKLSRADLAFAVAFEKAGSTTVAATMICAALAGIKVFATGGIGGVHRGAERTFDISADLTELARTPVAVVSSGAKAILDLPKTLEVLETNGVPVIGFGTDDFPAFWSRSSGLPAPLRLDHARDIAKFILTRELLGLNGGVVIANPVPQEAEIPAYDINLYIEAALAEAEAERVSSKRVTPFLLSRIVQTTSGRSLATNIALVKSNARLAAEIAVELTAAA